MAGLLDDYRLQPNLPAAMGQTPMPDMSALNQADNLGRLNQMANQPTPPQPPQTLGSRAMGILGAIGGGIKRSVQDPNFADRLVIGLGGMSMNPNQVLMQQAAANIEQRRAMDLLGKQANQTAEWLKTQPGGAPYAQLLIDNPTLKATDVIAMYNADKSKEKFETITGDVLNQRFNVTGYDPQALYKVSSNGEIIAIQGAEKEPEQIRAYNTAVAQGLFDGSFEEFKRLGSAEQLPPTSFREYELAQEDPAYGEYLSERQRQQAEIAAGARPVSDSQMLSAGFYRRALDSQRLLTSPIEINGEMVPLEFAGTQLSALAESLPLGGAERFLMSDEYLQFQQAKTNFVTAVLRKESGAAISAEEFTNEDKKYFPQPGDNEKLIEQKRKARELAIQNLKNESGRAIEPQRLVPMGNTLVLSDGKVVQFDSPENAAAAAKDINARMGFR